MSDEEEAAEFASPPCYMHEFTPEYHVDLLLSDTWNSISKWRYAERERLIKQRLTVDAKERQARSCRIASLLDLVIGKYSGHIVGTYWPYRGEPDLRNWAIRVIERGGRIALPVVVQRDRPLEYRIWAPGDLLERGVGNILVPSRGPAIQPDVVIAPGVGFDEDHFRLGYGGGFFDRTLASMPRKPLTIGVGYVQSRISTIYPQPHDIPMDLVVTD